MSLYKGADCMGIGCTTKKGSITCLFEILLRKELFKFSLTVSIMMPSFITSDLHFVPLHVAQIYFASELQKFVLQNYLCNVYNPYNLMNSPFKTCSLLYIHSMICPNVIAMPTPGLCNYNYMHMNAVGSLRRIGQGMCG